MVRLFAEACQLNGAVGEDVEPREAAVLGARAFDHRHQRAVVYAFDVDPIVLVAVSLEDGQDVARLFEHLAYLWGVLYAMVVLYVQPLVSEYDSPFCGRSQVGP